REPDGGAGSRRGQRLVRGRLQGPSPAPGEWVVRRDHQRQLVVEQLLPGDALAGTVWPAEREAEVEPIRVQKLDGGVERGLDQADVHRRVLCTEAGEERCRIER